MDVLLRQCYCWTDNDSCYLSSTHSCGAKLRKSRSKLNSRNLIFRQHLVPLKRMPLHQWAEAGASAFSSFALPFDRETTTDFGLNIFFELIIFIFVIVVVVVVVVFALERENFHQNNLTIFGAIWRVEESVEDSQRSKGKPIFYVLFFKKMGHSRLLFLYFRLFQYTVDSKQMFNINKFLPMTGFKPQTSGIGSDRSTNWATQPLPILCLLY